MNLIQKLTRGCTGDCSISEGGSISTVVYATPNYDKNGTSTTIDPNVHTTEYHCNFCNMRWTVQRCMGKTTIDPPVDE